MPTHVNWKLKGRYEKLKSRQALEYFGFEDPGKPVLILIALEFTFVPGIFRMSAAAGNLNLTFFFFSFQRTSALCGRSTFEETVINAYHTTKAYF